jgi:branched-chain amino acid transport system ATP-binding protein
MDERRIIRDGPAGIAGAATLRIEALSLRFGGVQVLDDVAFEVEPGELFALIGPNGAGKTSVLNCICGIYRPTSGRVLIDGQLLTGLQPHRIARAGVARTFQHAELVPQLTVTENLLIARHTMIRTGVLAEGLRLPHVRREEAIHRERVEAIIEFVELERWRDRAVGSLAFGLQKVVGFARALALEPRLLLLDEPSAGLNRDEREDLARHLLRIQHELGTTMLWVEHDMQMVSDLADRCQVLVFGRPLARGTPSAVLAQPEVAAAYLGQATAAPHARQVAPGRVDPVG